MYVIPYKYPYFRKSEIKKLVVDMLKNGIIRESKSSFPSLILFVKKKNGSRQFCIDYQALNAITV